ncbi:MAG TPA: YceI family protein [Thermoanaerobaculia bacterium]|nr:YceI family protein [Thermoanaerobaculia bacterium]
MRRGLSQNALIPALALIAVLAADIPPARAGNYVLDRIHSDATFKVRHLVARFTGKFNDFNCSITGDPAKPADSSVQFTIKTASIDTGQPIRDDHLRSADFFDVEKFPEITFKSTSIKTSSRKNVYEVTGDLTMHGVTKRITLPVEYLGTIKSPRGYDAAGLTLTATINRKDFGIVWNETLDGGGLVLGDEVEVTINLEMAKKAPAASEGTKEKTK